MKLSCKFFIVILFSLSFYACSDDSLQIPDAENYYCIDNNCIPINDNYRAFIDSANSSYYLRIELYGYKPFIIGSVLYIHIYNSNFDSIPQSGSYYAVPLIFNNNNVHAANSAEMHLYAIIQDQVEIGAWPVTDLLFIEPKINLNVSPIDSITYQGELYFKGFFESNEWNNYKILNVVLNNFKIICL